MTDEGDFVDRHAGVLASLRAVPKRLASAATTVSLVSGVRGRAPYHRDLGWRRLVLGTVGGFVCWAAWMGWDVYYDIDPVTGGASGPYHPWQVVGSALSLLVVVLVTGFSSRPRVAIPTYALITAGYTTGFCVSAIITSALFAGGGASLWPIGAAMLFIGAGTGIYIVGGLVSLLRAVTRPAAGPSQREH